jgi:hypothetical protein
MLDAMAHIELIPTRTADGTVVLRAAVVGHAERLRRLLRRLTAARGR